ncbi:unnamed protein product [Blepharisma stoltei]|uniref:Cation/H+ exchanger transmembrane domain-containing protein n=1 Tax=Blepharisma stoltei TaxID=1481888 RepID=A0AAU9K5S0_9CILI|nr:unnamed protein product [Blepharisma stoltei]
MAALVVESILCTILVSIFMVLSVYIPTWKINYFHESGIIIIIGICIGLFMDGIGDPLAKFNSQIFFDFMLPFLILSSGYNMKRRRFFANIGIILLLGIIGTLFQFILVSLSAYLFSLGGALKDLEGQTYHFSPKEAIAIGALLASSDSACVLALVNESKAPKLHSIIFGESIMNDAMSILLIHTLPMVSLTSVSASEVFVFLGVFLYYAVTSILLGIFFGVVSAILTRNFEILREDPSKSIALQLYVSLMSYMCAQALGLAENVTLMVCGIISGHYAWHNLGKTSKIVASNGISFIGDAAEALIFSYLGLTAFSYKNDHIDFIYIFTIICSILIARLLSTVLLLWAARIVTKSKFHMTKRAISIVWMGGLIRGAVAYALALDLDYKDKKMITITVLGVVITTAVIFGSLLPLWVAKIKPDGLDIVSVANEIRDESLSMSVFGKRKSLYITKEEVLPKNWIHRHWKIIDEKYIKPCLIHPDPLKTHYREVEELNERMQEAVEMSMESISMSFKERNSQDTSAFFGREMN